MHFFLKAVCTWLIPVISSPRWACFFPFAIQNSVAIMINLQNFLRMKHKFKKKKKVGFFQPPNKNIQLEFRRMDQNSSIFIFLEVESRGLSKPLIVPYLTWLLSLNVFAKQSVSFYYATKYLHCWQNNGLNMSSQMFCWNCLFYLFFLFCFVFLCKIHFGSTLLSFAADAKIMQ